MEKWKRNGVEVYRLMRLVYAADPWHYDWSRKARTIFQITFDRQPYLLWYMEKPIMFWSITLNTVLRQNVGMKSNVADVALRVSRMPCVRTCLVDGVVDVQRRVSLCHKSAASVLSPPRRSSAVTRNITAAAATSIHRRSTYRLSDEAFCSVLQQHH